MGSAQSPTHSFTSRLRLDAQADNLVIPAFRVLRAIFKVAESPSLEETLAHGLDASVDVRLILGPAYSQEAAYRSWFQRVYFLPVAASTMLPRLPKSISATSPAVQPATRTAVWEGFRSPSSRTNSRSVVYPAAIPSRNSNSWVLVRRRWPSYSQCAMRVRWLRRMALCGA